MICLQVWELSWQIAGYHLKITLDADTDVIGTDRLLSQVVKMECWELLDIISLNPAVKMIWRLDKTSKVPKSVPENVSSTQ